MKGNSSICGMCSKITGAKEGSNNGGPFFQKEEFAVKLPDLFYFLSRVNRNEAFKRGKRKDCHEETKTQRFEFQFLFTS